jgi:hypothetical protein
MLPEFGEVVIVKCLNFNGFWFCERAIFQYIAMPLDQLFINCSKLCLVDLRTFVKGKIE